MGVGMSSPGVQAEPRCAAWPTFVPAGSEEEKARGQCIAQHTESKVARSLAGTITEVRPYRVWGCRWGDFGVGFIQNFLRSLMVGATTS